MPTPYGGDPDVFPEEGNLPSDGDDLDASSINPALEALFDRTAYLAAHGVPITTVSFSSSGTWEAPPGATFAMLEAFGGGGGGGGGANSAAAGQLSSGGGGGGGSRMVAAIIPLVAGSTYTIVIGAGGAGGAAAANGSAGGDTSITPAIGAPLIIARGGGGGLAGKSVSESSQRPISAGGLPTNLVNQQPMYTSSALGNPFPIYGVAGHGGHGLRVIDPTLGGAAVNCAGAPSDVYGYAGGAAGTTDVTFDGAGPAFFYGGGSGGGGGGGPGGAGGAGGNGGTPSASGIGSSGVTAGAAPGGNTGAGGGGGGAAGDTAASTSGGAGAAGGSGYLFMRVFAGTSP